MSSPLGPTNQTGYPSGTTPTVAATAAAGTTATATVQAGSLDQRGAISVSSAGTGQAVGAVATVTLAKGVSVQGIPQVMITELTGPSSAVNPFVTGVTPNSFQIGVNTALTAGTTYQFAYTVIP
jgi:hypothetical protein